MNKLQTGKHGTGLAVVALIVGLGLSPMVEASTADEDSFVVDATGLNQESVEGAAVLYGKLQFAAESVCGLHEARGYAPRRRARRCVDATLQAVVAEVGGSLLKARHDAESRLVQRTPAGVLVPATASARR